MIAETCSYFATGGHFSNLFLVWLPKAWGSICAEQTIVMPPPVGSHQNGLWGGNVRSMHMGATEAHEGGRKEMEWRHWQTGQASGLK